MNITKVRPLAEVYLNHGNDGRDSHYDIAYSCPKCRRRISFYKSETVCDQCGTFYDWGTHEPEIEIIRIVRWD